MGWVWPGGTGGLFPPSPSSISPSGGTGGAGTGAGVVDGEEGWTLPCLSVRTGWDLLLRALALPVGSEVRGDVCDLCLHVPTN